MTAPKSIGVAGAREALARGLGELVTYDYRTPEDVMALADALITAAMEAGREEGRAEALEEAACLAETSDPDQHKEHVRLAREAGSWPVAIATAIRARALKVPS